MNQDIIDLAWLLIAEDQSSLVDDPALVAKIEEKLQALASDEFALSLSMFARNMLSGKPYLVSTDNPARLRRWREFAAELGAVIAGIEESDGETKIMFVPRQLS